MLKKLRIKFITVAMCATALVLVTIIGFINIHNYVDINRSADETLHLLEINDGKFPMRDNAKDTRNDMPPKDMNGGDPQPGRLPGKMSPEAPYETRFFTVTLDGDGNTLAVNTDKIAAVDSGEAENYAASLFRSGKKSGFIENYKSLRRMPTTAARCTSFLIADAALTRGASFFWQVRSSVWRGFVWSSYSSLSFPA